MERYCKIWGCS